LGRKFGLLSSTSGKWFTDKLKMPAISFAAFFLIETGLSLNLFNLTWLFVATSISAIVAIFVFSSAAFSDSHFYKCVKLKDEELMSRFTKLFNAAGLKSIRVLELKTEKLTTKGIAASSGIGFTKRILLSDTLLSIYSKDEIESVVGHEIGHHKKGHLWKYAGVFTFFLITAFTISTLIVQSINGRLGLGGLYSAASIPLWALVFGVAFACFVPLLNMLSREAEGECDQYELELVGKPEAYISSMIKLGEQNLRYATPNNLVEIVFYNHPSCTERVERALIFKKAQNSK
jgi:STE24 endopeptidase